MKTEAPSPSPVIVLAMAPGQTRHVLTADHLARLARLAGAPLALPCPDPAALPTANILVTGWGCAPLTPQVLDRMPGLRLVAHAAGTVRGLLPDAFWDRGIAVTSAAAANAIPVAEYTLAAILSANKRVDRFRREFAAARGPSTDIKALADDPIGNLGKTVGIIGASMIGRLVMGHLARFDVAVLLADPHVDPVEARALGALLVPLPELMSLSDVVSLHAPLTTHTRGLIDMALLARMRDGATFINTARGAIVDTAALTAEIVSGRIEAVLDVTEPEPLPADSPLWDAPNATLTPHVAGALGLERNRLGALIVDEVERFITGEPLRHAVDPRRRAMMA